MDENGTKSLKWFYCFIRSNEFQKITKSQNETLLSASFLSFVWKLCINIISTHLYFKFWINKFPFEIM